MALRIKEICKEKQITMKEIAGRLGINPITLTQSLNGNPTLSRLQEVADILGVGVPELFDTTGPVFKEIHGCIYVEGAPRLITGKQDLINLVNEL